MDVFLLGSGFSKAVAPDDMPCVSDLLEALAQHLDDTMQSGRYGALVRQMKDVEAFFSFVSEDQPWLDAIESAENHTAFVRSREWLAEYLFRKQQHALGSACPGWLLELVDRWSFDRTPVITLNYDLIVEATVDTVRLQKIEEDRDRQRPTYRNLYPEILPGLEERYGGTYYMPDSVDAFPLLKLHGSLNWAYSPDSAGDVRVFDTGAVDRWEREQPTEWTDVRTRMRDLAPLIVPPVASKSPIFGTNGWMRSVWVDAARALDAADRVFVIGYSLPTSDLQVRNLLGPRVTSKLLHLVNTDTDSPGHFGALLNRTIDEGWTYPQEPVRNFAHWYVQSAEMRASQ